MLVEERGGVTRSRQAAAIGYGTCPVPESAKMATHREHSYLISQDTRDADFKSWSR
jgi:hypothetical protein